MRRKKTDPLDKKRARDVYINLHDLKSFVANPLPSITSSLAASPIARLSLKTDNRPSFSVEDNIKEFSHIPSYATPRLRGSQFNKQNQNFSSQCRLAPLTNHVLQTNTSLETSEVFEGAAIPSWNRPFFRWKPFVKDQAPRSSLKLSPRNDYYQGGRSNHLSTLKHLSHKREDKRSTEAHTLGTSIFTRQDERTPNGADETESSPFNFNRQDENDDDSPNKVMIKSSLNRDISSLEHITTGIHELSASITNQLHHISMGNNNRYLNEVSSPGKVKFITEE